MQKRWMQARSIFLTRSFRTRRHYQVTTPDMKGGTFYNLAVTNDTTMVLSELESMSFLFYRIEP